MLPTTTVTTTVQTVEIEVFDISPNIDIDTDLLSDQVLNHQACYECRCQSGSAGLTRDFIAIFFSNVYDTLRRY